MKKMILYVMMMGIAIAINSCEKETFEPDADSISFEDGIGRKVCFTFSLDKTRYMIGEKVTARSTASESLLYSSYYYDGIVTMAGNGDVLFSYTHLYFNKCVLPSCKCVLQSCPSCLCLSCVLVSQEIPVETTPGIYSATLAITRSGPFGFITKTKKVSISYEVR